MTNSDSNDESNAVFEGEHERTPEQIENAEVGNVLQTLIKREFGTQAAFSIYSGIKQNTLSQKLNGKSSVRITDIRQFDNALSGRLGRYQP